MADCIFCAIVAGDAPAAVVDADDETVAFLDLFPVAEGHSLVVPRRHSPDLFEAPPEDAAAVMRTTHRVAARLRAVLAPDGLNLLQSNGAVALQSVFHLHVHLVPRWRGDGFVLPTRPPSAADRADLEALAGRLRG